MLPTLARIIALPIRVLTWIGGQGARAIAALVFIGVAVPPLGELLKPYVTAAIFLLLCISFMRVDLAALRSYLRRPALVIAATAWTTLAVPAIAGLAALAAGADVHWPDVYLALMLQAVASPMMAAPALAAVMGLDATLTLVTLVTSTALVPFTAPLFAYVFLGAALKLTPLGLGLKLAAIRRHKLTIDGINILVLLVFVSAVMGHVAGSLFTDPLMTIELGLLCFAVFFLLSGVSALVFRAAGNERALAVGLMVSQRNMGLMVAATDGLLPGTTWLYFALSQFPIYLSPLLLKPIAQRLTAPKAVLAVPETVDA